jgi:hypothetical protein
MLIDLWYVILANATFELGSMVTSSWDDAKAGDILPTAIKMDKNAIIIKCFFNTNFHLLYL